MSVFPVTFNAILAVKPFNYANVMPLLQLEQLLDDEAIPLMEYTYTLKSPKHLGLLKLQAHTRSRKFPGKFWYKLAHKFFGASRGIFCEKCTEPMLVQAYIPEQNRVFNLLYNFRL
ncbi:hypothetical protein, partial [Cellulophaga baltica]|uniref:hypothetical protein n=1 Tax=Cellulophaga baltica TaxID=76594 RepID=UPI001C7163FE